MLSQTQNQIEILPPLAEDYASVGQAQSAKVIVIAVGDAAENGEVPYMTAHMDDDGIEVDSVTEWCEGEEIDLSDELITHFLKNVAERKAPRRKNTVRAAKAAAGRVMDRLRFRNLGGGVQVAGAHMPASFYASFTVLSMAGYLAGFAILSVS